MIPGRTALEGRGGDHRPNLGMAQRDQRRRFGPLRSAQDSEPVGGRLGLGGQPGERLVEGLERDVFEVARLAGRSEVRGGEHCVALVLKCLGGSVDVVGDAAERAADQQDRAS